VRVVSEARVKGHVGQRPVAGLPGEGDLAIASGDGRECHVGRLPPTGHPYSAATRTCSHSREADTLQTVALQNRRSRPGLTCLGGRERRVLPGGPQPLCDLLGVTDGRRSQVLAGR
jgi:hypothetical protein